MDQSAPYNRPRPLVCTCLFARSQDRHEARCDLFAPDPARFTLGTYASYYDGGNADGDLCAAVRDEHDGKVYPFGRWENAKRAIAEMRENPDSHHYASAVGTTDGFTPAEPGVDEGLAS